MQKITKDMIIGDILKMDPEMAGVLVAGGMHCYFSRRRLHSD